MFYIAHNFRKRYSSHKAHKAKLARTTLREDFVQSLNPAYWTITTNYHYIFLALLQTNIFFSIWG